MRTPLEHIEHLKTKPHTTRRQVAYGTALGVSALVAIVWFAGVFSSGTFDIQGTSFAESTQGQSQNIATVAPQNSALLGAAAAAQDQDPNSPAHIEIVSTATSSTLSSKQIQPEQTVIPF